MDKPQITLTRENMPSLEAAYQAAVEAGEDQFEWEGRTLVTSYAKYLIEWARPHVMRAPR